MEIDKISIKDIQIADYNPRQISDSDMEKLSTNLDEFGLVDPIIVDLTDDYTIVGGHQRYKVLQDKYDSGYELNLIRLGDIGWVFDETELKIQDKNHQKALNISLNKIQGEWDENKLNLLMDDLQKNNFDMSLTGFDVDVSLDFNSFEEQDNLTSFITEESDSEKKQNINDEPSSNGEKIEFKNSFEKYTQKVSTPLYEPKGDCPSVSELYDDSKTRVLLAMIEEHQFSDDYLKQFLVSAAHRLTSFNYSKIAEYYAHQDKEMQELMEELVLVIIDFDKAVEQGYVKIGEKYKEVVESFEE